jgi:hypothetical protein
MIRDGISKLASTSMPFQVEHGLVCKTFRLKACSSGHTATGRSVTTLTGVLASQTNGTGMLTNILSILHLQLNNYGVLNGVVGWDLAEWSERCASIPKMITSSNPSCGSKSTFRSDLREK